jgi:PIN domain nuclease of toxin-antitoxin system
MNVLMDTPASGLATRLSKPANSIRADADNTILVAAAVAWEVAIEVAIKASLGKLIALPLVMDLSNRIIEEGFCRRLL